jgi:hypothetical protein
MFRLEGRELELRDMVHGRRQFRAVGRLHFAPGCQLVVRGNQVSVRAGKGAMEIEFEGGGALDVGESPYYARFGQKVMRPVLEYRVGVVESASWRTIMRW